MPRQIRMPLDGPGPFTPEMVADGARYEIRDGHPIWCAPSGGQHSATHAAGTIALATAPGVVEVGTDVGYKTGEKELRAADIGLGNVPCRPGWVEGVPRIAVEYADRGGDEGDLQERIRVFLEGGTEAVWVVRLHGPRRVEVYARDGTVRLVANGGSLHAPGVLDRPIPMEALYDREASLDLALHNLLRRRGWEDLDAVLAEGREEGREKGREEGRGEGALAGVREALRRLYARRRWALPPGDPLESCTDITRLQHWLDVAADATSPDDLPPG